MQRGINIMMIETNISYKNDKLQNKRQAARLSQSQLAKAAGISVRVLQDYERGARNVSGAKLSTLLKICNALKCEMIDIITDMETKQLLEMYNAEK